MNLRDKKLWDEGLANNQDPYGNAVYLFAEKWADLMETEIANGKTVAEVAERCSSEACKGMGLTGFMYGCAVSTLSAVWEHGEDLRRWHNLDIQLGDEGEKANETGGVLNPAILNVGGK